MKLVLSLREEQKTFSEIGAELTLRGFTPQRGGRWFPVQVKAILDLNQRGAPDRVVGRVGGTVQRRGCDTLQEV